MTRERSFYIKWLILAVLFLVVVYKISELVFTADQNSITNSPGSRVKSTLQLVIVFSRHGNRSPNLTLTSFLYQRNDTDYWPSGPDQVTTHGFAQMYRDGKTVRSMYDGFLNEYFREEEFIAKSTVMDRTQTSAEAFLAGLFPPKGFQVWNKNLLWQPVPVFPTYLDNLNFVIFSGTENELCATFRRAQNLSTTLFYSENYGTVVSILDKVQPYIRKLSSIMGKTPIFFLTNLWDNLYCLDQEGFTLPSWASLVYPQPFLSFMSRIYQVSGSGSFEQIRLLEGTLFKEAIELMQLKMNGSLDTARKVYYYSGHDYTITGLLNILGLESPPDGPVPPGSLLILELHRDPNKKYYVQTLYGKGEAKPTLLSLPGCPYPCEFSRLERITQKYYNISDLQQECQLKTQNKAPDN